MHVARIILAALIAAAVALLPVAGNAMFATMAADMNAPLVMAADVPMDCCPDHAKHEQKAVDDCCAMACGLTGFSFSEPDSVLLPPLTSAEVLPALASRRLPSQTGHPPFRPPRV